MSFRNRFLVAGLGLVFLGVTCFGAKPVDSTAWESVPLTSGALPAELQKKEAWKNKLTGCVVTIVSVEGLPDARQAIAAAIGVMSPLIKAGVYPTAIYRDRGCPFPNVIMDGIFPGDIPCRQQTFFGVEHTHMAFVLRPPEIFFIEREFDLEDVGDSGVAEKINAYADDDHQKYLSRMQAIVSQLREHRAQRHQGEKGP